jgi:DNA-binding NtrC family response regulator
MRPAQHWRLRGEIEGKCIVLSLAYGDNVLGSGIDADARVPQPTVSRRHATIRVLDSQLFIQDLGSKNGTYVNGVRVEEADLRAGDKVQVGEATFVVEALDADDVALAIPLDRRRPPAAQTIEEPITRSGGGSDERVRWLDLVLRLGELVLEPAVPELAPALHELQQALAARSILLVEWSGSGDPRVVQVVGDAASLSAIEDTGAAFALVHEIGTKKRTRRTFEVPGKESLVLAVGAAPERPTFGLAVVGASGTSNWAKTLTEVVLQFITHSHSERRTSKPGALKRDTPDLVFPEGYVVGGSDAMRSLYWQVRQFVRGDLPVLITGETGVGKEHIARILHASSPRREGPFQAINCAAVPAGLLEAELFGVERGAATGVTERPGQFQLARGGLLFLDEVSELPLDLQAKLLRVLQSMEVHAVGARRPVRVDVRIAAATNATPEDLLASGRLRRDLYYRIAGCTFHVPPLRERREDIPALVEHFMRHHAKECGRHILGMSVRALRALVEASWPGNVRELENEVRRLVYLCPEGLPIEAGMLPARVVASRSYLMAEPALATESDLRLQPRIDDLERALIAAALGRTGGNRSKAAALLGVSRDGLRMKMVRLGCGD